jgi:hypothetical protein
LSKAFPIHNDLKEGDLSPLLFSFILEYNIRKLHENLEELEMNVTYQFLVYAYNNFFDVIINNIKKKKIAEC